MSQVFWLNSPVVFICNSATASHMNGMKNEEGEKNKSKQIKLDKKQIKFSKRRFLIGI